MREQHQQLKTFLERDNWMRAVNASGEPRGARCLAFAIALHLNVETGQCNPGHKTLSKEAGISERSVERFVALLERDGWLAIKRGGRGNNSNYALVRPASNLADQEHDRPASNLADQNYDPPVSAHMTRQFEQHDPPPVGGQKSKRKAKREKKGKKDISAPDVAAPKRAKKIPGEAQGKRQNKSRAASVDIDASFARFWSIYPKREEPRLARKAFAAALKRGVASEAINAGAERYAKERAGKDPTYTKKPAGWLDAGGYDNEPPPGSTPVIDEQGNVVAYEQPQQRQRNRGFAEIGEEMAEQIEREGNKWGWGD